MKNDFPHLENSPSLRRRMTEIARDFRKEPTRSEYLLWPALRGKKMDGIKFRRQQPVGSFVVDFYNSAYRLVIEVDGDVHDLQRDADSARQQILEELGLTFLRIRSETVEENLPFALNLIRSKIEEIKLKSSESPSPVLGEGQG